MTVLWNDFKKFLTQGSLITLAVAFIMATIFAAVVKALIVDIVTPIIAMIVGKPDFSSLTFTINSSHFFYGDFINAVITFVTTAAAVFLFVVKPYERYKAHRPADATTKECPECMSEIPIKARRCPQCTTTLSA